MIVSSLASETIVSRADVAAARPRLYGVIWIGIDYGDIVELASAVDSRKAEVVLPAPPLERRMQWSAVGLHG